MTEPSDRSCSPHTVDTVYRDATRAAVIGLVANLALALTKAVGGVVGRSFALIADAVNSFGDSAASVATIAALRYAQKPPDAEHPYGHTRAEAIAASNVAVLILVSATIIGWEALQRISLSHVPPPVWTLWIAGANVVIKEGLYRYKRRVGQRIGSLVVIANAWDHRSDALCSLAVLVGLGTIRVGGPAWIWADEAAALVVVVVILFMGATLFRRSAGELMDEQADSELLCRIREHAETTDGVAAVETLRVRKSGLEYLVDIHIEVDRNLTVERGHRIGHRVKDRLLTEFPRIRDILVHLEPFPHVHESAEKL